MCLASLSVLQQAEECDMAPCLQPGWARPHTQVRAGGHPESATVPVGCQAARLVKYHRCWPGPAPLGPCSQTHGAALVSGSSSYARTDTSAFLTVQFPSLSLCLSKDTKNKVQQSPDQSGRIAAVSRWASFCCFVQLQRSHNSD